MFVSRTGKIILAVVVLFVVMVCGIGIFVSSSVYPMVDISSVVAFWLVSGVCVISPVVSYVLMGVVAGGWAHLKEKDCPIDCQDGCEKDDFQHE